MKTALAALALILTASSAFAGDWHYGCVGQIDGRTNIVFNRDKVVLSSAEINSAKLVKLEDDSIQTLQSEDINAGLDKKMIFSNKWPDGTIEKLELTEVSSKSTGSTSEELKCTANRVRDITHETTTRAYKITLPGSQKATSAILKCYEYMVSACG